MNLRFQLLLFILAFFLSSALIGKELKLIQERTFQVESGQLLTIRTDLGDVVTKSWNKPELRIKIYGDSDAERKMEFTFDQDAVGVEVIGEKEGGKIFGWFNRIDLKYEIMVPSEFDLDIKTSGGDLSTKHVRGEFNLRTSGGDIYLKNSAGNLSASTSGGDITLNEFEGDAELSTSGGDIEVDASDGKVFANTSGGDISLKASHGPIEAKTSGGDIALVYSGENQGIKLRTSGGEIDVKLPTDFNANVDIRTSGGDITNNFSENRMSKISKSSLKGKFNNGGNLLICKTSGGDITILEK